MCVGMGRDVRGRRQCVCGGRRLCGVKKCIHYDTIRVLMVDCGREGGREQGVWLVADRSADKGSWMTLPIVFILV